jgi:hypothetical protein
MSDEVQHDRRSPSPRDGGRRDAVVSNGTAAKNASRVLTDDRAWSVADVAYFLNVSDSMVRKLEREGKLPSLPRYCSRVTFDPKVVRAFRDGTLCVGLTRHTGSGR